MYWKFICTSATEAECFQRGLFGDTVKFLDEIRKIKRGDTLFLYNVNTDVLFGPFVAESNGGLNLEPDAWGGHFPAQVKVGWETISLIQGASTRFGFLKTRTVKLSEEQGRELLKVLTLEHIRIPSHLKSEVQQLDMEIHTLAHRMEEVMCGRGHPANREIELDKLKGEITAKMRDFVWAVRKLDKQTRILDLPSNK